MFLCLDLAKTLEMLPQVPPLPLEGLVVCLFLLPIIIGSGSSGELNCSTDLKIKHAALFWYDTGVASKAFDRLWHPSLVPKLSCCGITPKLIVPQSFKILTVECYLL